MTIPPTIRQLLVIASCQLSALSSGGAMGYPMVLLHQLSAADSPIKLDLHTSSWIGSMHGLAGIACVIVPTFMQRMGRKPAFIAGCLTVTLGWLVAYTAWSVTSILVSELIHGFGTNTLYVVALQSMSEMTSPSFRNISVQSYGTLQALGMALSGALSTFLHRQYVCIIMAIPIVVAFCMSVLWPESPAWLACKGRFDECHEAFRQLRKFDAPSKLELEELVAAQKENLLQDKSNDENSLPFIWSKLKRRHFYMPAIHVYVLLSLLYWSGSAFVIINSFDLIQRVTSNERAPYWGGIVLNSLFFIGMLFSSIINKQFKTKTVLLTSVICASVCSLGVVVTTSLQSAGIITTKSLVSVYFLFAYSTFNSLGIIPMVFTIISEIMPVKHRGMGGAVYVIFNSILYATALKISPYLCSYINVWGTFLVYTFNAIVCGLIIWKFVPETKSKTLQQIEDFYMFGKFITNRTQNGENTHCIALLDEDENVLDIELTVLETY